jgi:thiamine kinase-like enzyme
VYECVNKRPQPKYLVLEELPKDKYARVNRRLGLSFDELKFTLEKLAKFHACTAAMYETNRELFSNHQIPNVSEYFKTFHPMLHLAVARMSEEIEKDNPKSAMISKLKEFSRNMIDKVSEAFMIDEDEMGVLCHGDLWIHNLLFRYDSEKKPIDLKMVRNDGCSIVKPR